MRKTNKRGFTIVELVIVIAVIAILAAVLIPTFTNLVKKANQSADTQLVRNMNMALQVDGASTKTYATAYDALKAASDAGYDLTKITTSDKENTILWDSLNQCFVYMKKGATAPEYIPNSKKDDAEKYQLWKVYDTVKEDGEYEYSVYWNGAENVNITVAGVGFDAGEKTVSSVTYNGASDARDVVIRTNSESTALNITVFETGSGETYKSDTISVYGLTGLMEIVKGGSHSVHTYGYVGFATVQKGVFLAKGGSVAAVYLPDPDEAKAKNDGGEIGTMYVNSADDKTRLLNNGATNVSEEMVKPLYTGESTDQTIIANAIEAELINKKAEAKNAVGEKAFENGSASLTGAVNASVRIGTTGYETIADAVAAAPNNVQTKITLLKDVSEGQISPDKNIVLELGGYTLTGIAVSAGSVINNEGGTLVIQNGRIYTNTAKYAIQNTSGSITIKDDVIVENRRPSTSDYTTCINAANGTITIEGGEFYSATGYNVKSYCLITGTNGTIVVKGGTFQDTGICIANASKITLEGGKFSQDVSNFCGANKYTKDGGDGFYYFATLTEEDANVRIDSDYYYSLKKAIAGAKDGDEIILLKNIDVSKVTIDKKLTLDLGDHIVTNKEGGSTFTIKSDCTIKNGSINQNIGIKSTNCLTISVGACTIEGVKIQVGNDVTVKSAVNVATGTTLNFNGGSISGTTNGIIGDGTATITGGTFSFNPSNNINNDTHTVTQNDDGTWTVTAK